jgi:hypothetical protein
MSFTQKERRNIGVCNGCDKRCALGVHQETTDNAGPIVSMWPTIAGKKIEHFINHQGQSEPTIMTSAVKDLPMDANNASVYADLMRQTQIENACTIARLCDHYKTR